MNHFFKVCCVSLFFLLLSINSSFILFAQDDYQYEEYDEDYQYDDYQYEETPQEQLENPPIIPDISNTPNTTIPTPTRVTNINIPVLDTYQSTTVVDPNDPVLPAHHRIVKLRGTVWKSDNYSLYTNKRGVISYQRLYIFFDKNRDAISYQYTDAQDRKAPFFPSKSSFIPLVPLLQTNEFVPIADVQVSNTPNALPLGNVNYRVNPPMMRNYQYKESLEALIKQNENIDIVPPDFTTENTNTIIVSNVLNDTGVSTNTRMEVITNITFEEQNFEFQPIKDIIITNSSDSNTFSFRQKNQDWKLNSLPVGFVAQQILTIASNQYIMNLGGEYGGIFMHETNDPNTPYRILFLSLDQGMTLHEYNLGTSLSPLNTALPAVQQARDLYLRILQDKINMQRLQQVPHNIGFIDRE